MKLNNLYRGSLVAPDRAVVVSLRRPAALQIYLPAVLLAWSQGLDGISPLEEGSLRPFPCSGPALRRPGGVVQLSAEGLDLIKRSEGFRGRRIRRGRFPDHRLWAQGRRGVVSGRNQRGAGRSDSGGDVGRQSGRSQAGEGGVDPGPVRRPRRLLFQPRRRAAGGSTLLKELNAGRHDAAGGSCSLGPRRGPGNRRAQGTPRSRSFALEWRAEHLVAPTPYIIFLTENKESENLNGA